MKTLPILIGKPLLEYKQKRIAELLGIVKGNSGWRSAFIKKYPFFDTIQGGALLNASTRGITSCEVFLECLTEFIAEIEITQPVWFKKQLKIEIPTKEVVAS